MKEDGTLVWEGVGYRGRDQGCHPLQLWREDG